MHTAWFSAASSVDLPPLSRRRFLLSAGSALLLTACGPDGPATTPGAPATAPSTPTTASAFFTRPEFFIAHRGSYDNWPEHTMKAYASSVSAGAEALELSVNKTSDGVLVCHHDPTTDRNADKVVTIASTTYAELDAVPVDAREWLGPQTPLEPVPRLKDVLDAFASTRVLLIEDKQGTNTDDLLDLMDSYADAKEHLVWKQWAAAGQWQAAKDRGYARWGFFTTDILDRVEELAPRFDYLGVPVTATDAKVKEIVALGKPVIAYEVHTRSEHERMKTLGVQGMMCSNFLYVAVGASSVRQDAFGTGLRAAGDLPWTTSKGASYQPVLDVLTSSLTISHPGIQSYSMGSMCPLPSDTYTLGFEIRWPEGLPKTGQHVGVAFGMADDSPYRVLEASTVGGYHMIIRSNGLMELYKRDAGTVSGTQLAVRPTGTPAAGDWMSFQITVSPERIRVERRGLATWQFEVDESAFRGGYFCLCKNYGPEVPAQFRSVSVS